MKNSNTTSAELKKQFRAEVRQLIEINSPTSTTPKWMTELKLRKLAEQYDSLTAERENSESKVISLQRELRDSKKMNIALSASAPTKTIASSAPSPALKDEIEEFLQFKTGEWKDRSYTQNKSNLIRFAEIIGMDRTCSSLTGDDMRYYLSVLKKLPKNIGKLRKVTDLHSNDDIRKYWRDAAENHSGESLSLPGVEKHLTVVRGFLLRLHSLGFTQSDLTPFLRQGKKALNKERKKRSEYDTETLTKIFNSYVYSDRLRRSEKPKPFHFWAPLIALTTGMRVAEIAALEMEDIVTVDGVRCFNLNDKWHSLELRDSGLDKSKKNETSLRKIPIPVALIDAGFDSFISGRKSGLLFEELSLSATKGLGNEISRWYNEFYREYADIPKINADGATLVFHCFRHTFTTRLDKTLIDGHPISESGGKYLTGHSDGSVRTQVYNHGLDMAYLKRYIDAIDYGQILDGVDYKRFLKRRKR